MYILLYILVPYFSQMSLLSQALFSAQSLDTSTRSSGYQTLESLAHANPVEYLINLALELAKPSLPSNVRQLAGIMIKNLVNNSTKDPALEMVWDKVDVQSKTLIRNSTLGTLASDDKDVRLICSQTVSALACIDIPKGQWQDLLSILITNASNINTIFKVSAIRTLGYICEGLPQGTVGKEQADSILTSLALSLGPNEKDLEVKQVALIAFRNSLKFISANINDPNERGIILNLLYTCCQDSTIDIRKEAMMIICDVLSLYYDCLESNLIELGSLTYSIIKNDVSAVSIYAIEFWNQAADEEFERIRYREKPFKGYTTTAAASLVPLLLEKIHLLDEDNEEWNLHKASACTLGSLSNIIGDGILELVGSYITAELKSESWQKRVSAAAIIGTIVEGISNIQLLVQYTLSDLLKLLSDKSVQVKETSAWSLSKICEFHSFYLISNNYFNPIIQEILKSLDQNPKIATHCCWAIVNLFVKAVNNPSINIEIVEKIVDALINTSIRPDAYSTEHDLLLASYSALNKIIEEIPEGMLMVFTNKIPIFLKLLEETIANPSKYSAQPHLFTVFHDLFGRSPQGFVTEVLADSFVQMAIEIFKLRATVVEEGLEAIGILSENMQSRFEKYISAVMPFVEWSLEIGSSSAAKGGVLCVGDMSRSLGVSFAPYLARLLPRLLNILSSDQVNFDVKVRSIETIADFANHTTLEFSRHLLSVLTYIESASSLSLDLSITQSNADMNEYLLDLRESIITFYGGIIQGLNDIHTGESLIQYLPKIIDYSMIIVQDIYNPNINIHTSVLGILGDIANYYASKATSYLKVNNIDSYINASSKSQEKSVSDMAIYAKEKIKLI